MLRQIIRLAIVAATAIGAGLLVQSARAADTVDSLAADPQRLREVQKLCKDDWAGTGDELCTMASKAQRRRFMGSGKTPYTPHPVDLFPSLKKSGTPEKTDPVAPDAE
ncbi:MULTISPECIES: entry exclusion lipoprotein TrbK [Xanthobacter]|uniref:entry exclusion lipoprotein TrbK n=1 Tax=Xanthobacter autotrophicus TaxID=280 RepID=UPI00372C78AE